MTAAKRLFNGAILASFRPQFSSLGGKIVTITRFCFGISLPATPKWPLLLVFADVQRHT